MMHAAERILAALDATQETDIQGYCQSCLWTPKAKRDAEKCDGLIPKCGGKKNKLAPLFQAYDITGIIIIHA